MSVKHVKAYFDEVAEQRRLMLEEIKDFEKEAEQNIIEPERLEMIKQNIQPLLNNYQMLSYIMFLLNKPNKKEKQKAYEKMNKKLLQSIDKKFTKEGVIQQNQDVIDSFKTV